MNTHLTILHLEGTTEDDKINTIANIRLGRLLKELESNSIIDYTIMPGFYDKINTKEAIHKGHLRIVELAKKQGLENCIIAEDDFCFTHPDSYKYFLNSIPESYDLFFGVVYAGEINECNRVMNGFSGGCTLYSIHSRFYDTFLSQDTNTHIDRNLGNLCHIHEFYVCDPQIAIQRGGYSYNLKMNMQYTPYMENKKFYGREGEIFHDGKWIDRNLYGKE